MNDDLLMHIAVTPERIVAWWEWAMENEDFDLALEFAYFMKRVELGLAHYDIIH